MAALASVPSPRSLHGTSRTADGRDGFRAATRVLRLLGGLAAVAALAVALIVAVDGTTRTLSYDYEQAHAAATSSVEVGAAGDEDVPASSRHAKDDYDTAANLARTSARPGQEGLAPNTAGGGVPSVVFSRSRAPGIAQNFDDAVANGVSTRQTRADAAARDANRRAALRGQSPAPAGQSLDGYPFACSAQGGCGSFVRSVPVGEQSYQGGVLSRFFQDFGIRPGDPFDVMFGP